MDAIEVAAEDIEDAVPVVREVAYRTVLLPFRDPGGAVFLKLENLQRLGAFKIRGTWNRLSRMAPEERRRGLTTISSGNHGLSLAWAAERLGVPCVVRVSEGAAQPKVEAIRARGAQVMRMTRAELVRAHEEEAWRSWSETFIHPFAHPHTIAGQGTIGLEIAEDAPQVRTVLVPVGGGGLASGIALAVKSRVPEAKVYGVQAEGAASLPTALRTSRPYRVEDPRTIADGIGVGLVVPNMVDILRRALDGCLLVSDAEILAAMRTLALQGKVVAEPAGAAAFAALERYRGELAFPVAVVVSGGNVDPALLSKALAQSVAEP